ncbi:LPS export ABC transporter periplasmic protein LptC [Marinobacter sp. NP-4(2019)]|uniref:LPS export ABC transporter periplasmic protein LptC n=1 Tax=Marinobacter sp. NP-4(2019) TaxID=2488665 RepID=UPI000FC3E95D|nr:LPS export ABC transporter periplasmic protein LptC [Marinobacter sp. NP-4(2019)]AZT84584.1 LPS export ABC transporter periplasmic protein LptC [Marinobacter sp. NP-4(2019)]
MRGNLLPTLLLVDRPWLRTLALGCTIVALIVMMWQSDEPQEPVDAAALRGQSEPDGFVVNGRYLSYDETGKLNVRFESPRIEQFEASNRAIMESPRAELFGEGESEPWHLSSDTGTYREADGLLHLKGNVKVIRTAGDRRGILTTSRLTLDNNSRTVYTDAPVTLTDSFSVTRATGMKAWIDARILELDSQVEGRYEPGQQANP